MSRYGMGAPVPVVEKDVKYAYPAPMNVPLVDPIAPINGPPVSPGVLDSLKCPDGAQEWLSLSEMAERGCKSLGVKTKTGTTVQYQACCPLIVKGPGGGTYVPAAMPLKPMPSAEDLSPGVIEQVAPGKVVYSNGNVVPGVEEMVMMKPEGFKPYTPTPVPTTESLIGPNVVLAPTLNLMNDNKNNVADAEVNAVVNNVNGNGNGNGNGATGGDWLTNTLSNGDVLLSDGNGTEVIFSSTDDIIPSDNGGVVEASRPNYLLWGGLGLAAAAAAWYFLRNPGTTRTTRNPGRQPGRGHHIVFSSTHGSHGWPYKVSVGHEDYGVVIRSSSGRWAGVDNYNRQGPWFDTRREAASWLVYDNERVG